MDMVGTRYPVDAVVVYWQIDPCPAIVICDIPLLEELEDGGFVASPTYLPRLAGRVEAQTARNRARHTRGEGRGETGRRVGDGAGRPCQSVVGRIGAAIRVIVLQQRTAAMK